MQALCQCEQVASVDATFPFFYLLDIDHGDSVLFLAEIAGVTIVAVAVRRQGEDEF